MSETFGGIARELKEADIALSLTDVVKEFGEKRVVDGLSLQVRRGEIFALLGPNGAGKTTMIDMCVGFQLPTMGAISVLGLNPATQADDVRARVGIMLQDGGSYSSIKVAELLELNASYSVDPLPVEWLISTLGLDGVRNTTYRRLSGGQKQRVSLALALIGRPELVFLDEPTAGMDAQSRLAVWELIGALRRDGVTVVITTHLMDEAEALADYVAIVDHGRLVAAGTPEKLTGGGTDSLRFSTASELDLAAANTALKSYGIEITAIRPLHYAIPGAPNPETIARIASVCSEQSVLIRSLDVAHASLEEIFLVLTGRELRS